MAKLYFYYSTMNAGKSTMLLQASYNYQERGMQTLLLTAAIDNRGEENAVSSRIGLSARAVPFHAAENLFMMIQSRRETHPGDCVFIDEA